MRAMIDGSRTSRSRASSVPPAARWATRSRSVGVVGPSACASPPGTPAVSRASVARPSSTRTSTCQPSAAAVPPQSTCTATSRVPVVRSSARPGIGPDVGQVHGSGGVEEDRARDPAVPPLVLVLDVGGVRPLHDGQADPVGAGRHEARHVELGGQVRVLAEADLAGRSPRPAGRSPRRRRGGRPAGPPRRPGPRASARTPRSGSPRGSTAAARGTASGRSCTAACRANPCIVQQPGTSASDHASASGRVRARQQLEAPAAVQLHAVQVRHAVHRHAARPGQLGDGPRRRGHARTRHGRSTRTVRLRRWIEPTSLPALPRPPDPAWTWTAPAWSARRGG